MERNDILAGTAMATPRLFLIDGSNQMYRAYHAIRGLTGPDGRSTNAVYGFVTMLRKLLVDHAPAWVAAAFDVAGPTFRDQLVDDYKANRAPMPTDLAEQIPRVHEACAALGVPVLLMDGFEADDVLGSLAAQASARGIASVLVTGDKDFFQLVSPLVQVFNPRDDGTWFDADGVRAKFGVAPAQVVDVLALMGDTIDNVKGVPGIGEKGARELIARFGSLEALLDGAPTLTQKKYRDALLQHADVARQSRTLVTIRTDVPVALDLEQLAYRGPDKAACFSLFSQLGFRSLVTEFAPTSADVAVDYALLDDADAVDALVREAREAGHVSCALVEDTSASGMPVYALAFSLRARHARVVILSPPRRAAMADSLFDESPVTTDASPSLDTDVVLSRLDALFDDPAIERSGHDLKPLVRLLRQRGPSSASIADDTLLASYVLDPSRSSHALDALALDVLNYQALRREDVFGTGVKRQTLDTLDEAARLRFVGEQADLSGQLRPTLALARAEAGVDGIYRTLELPLLPVLADMERAGIRVDPAVLNAQGASIDEEMALRSARIFAAAGVEFNINSPRQLAEVLFDTLQLPITKRTGKAKTPSTAIDVLEELALVHDVPRDVLEWRGMMKLKGTYVEALPQLIHPDTGRVHTTYNQAVAATGRLSSSDPNLQNIPIRTELGRRIRAAFVAEPGCVLISADYSQIELRVLAHLARETVLLDAFARGDDIHDQTAATVFGSESGLSPHELRRRAKIINYALLYGKTAFTLAKDIGVTQAAAQAFIDAYFSGYPGVRAFIERTLQDARVSGEVRTLAGRRRLVPELTSRNGQIRAAAERVAVNMPIQGTAADILKQAMIDVHAALGRFNGGAGWRARMLLTVHDELVVESRGECADEVAGLVRTCMEQAVHLDAPLTVDIGIGEDWSAAKG